MTTGQSPNLAFSREEFADRLRRTREGLVSRGLDAGIFFATESIYYLSGYDSPSHVDVDAQRLRVTAGPDPIAEAPRAVLLLAGAAPMGAPMTDPTPPV
jgi:Xaa-Pro aminopeptidase